MIQFNLLPDVKLNYIRATYRKRVIIVISTVVTALFLTIFVLLFLFVRINQPRHVKNLDRDITKKADVLKGKQDLDKILTIQNQLNSLPKLHEDKVFSSRLFDYLTQMTPNQATISSVDLDLEAHTINLKGKANDITTVNKFIDTIKFTEYKVNDGGSSPAKAFSGVVLKGFTLATSTDQTSKIEYEIDFSYETIIFSNTAKEGDATARNITLIVPKITTTRSETQKPADLFQADQTAPANDENGGQR